MANYLERVVLSGSRAASPASLPASAPAMLPIDAAPVAMPAGSIPNESPEIGERMVVEPAGLEQIVAPRFRAPEPPDATGVPRPEVRVGPATVEKVSDEKPAAAVPPSGEPPVLTPMPEGAPPAEAFPNAIHTDSARSEQIEPQPPPVIRSPAAIQTPLAKVAFVPVPTSDLPPLKPSSQPEPPIFFRFQQPPVHIEAPRGMRPARPAAAALETQPAPPEPVALSAPVAVPFKPDEPGVQAAKPVQIPVRIPQQTVTEAGAAPRPKAAAAPSLMPTPASARQKRIHIGAVEVHLHNEAPPAPEAVEPRPAAPNHSDPFEHRSLSRFTFRL